MALERRRYQQARERVAIAPERFLDLLVHRRRRLPGRPAVPALPGTDDDDPASNAEG
jgi:hypothetical protein